MDSSGRRENRCAPCTCFTYALPDALDLGSSIELVVFLHGVHRVVPWNDEAGQDGPCTVLRNEGRKGEPDVVPVDHLVGKMAQQVAVCVCLQ